MTGAAKKAAASKPDTQPMEQLEQIEEIEPYLDPIDEAEQALSSAKAGPAAAVAAGLATIALAEEQRTANLIALLALGQEAWADLYAAGADAEVLTELVVYRLGLAGQS